MARSGDLSRLGIRAADVSFNDAQRRPTGRRCWFPDFNALRHPATYGVAFTIATVASLETLLSIEAVDNLDPRKRHTPPNRELLAQGPGSQQWRLGWARLGR